MRSRHSLTHIAAVVATVILATALPRAYAQDKYPNRPIRMLVGYTAGGGPDIVARLVAPKLSALLGQQVVVDNRPGAGGSLAENIVSNAAPDGYTILACSNSLSINPFLNPKLPYNAQNDLTPVSLTGISAQVLIVRPAFTAKTVAELVAAAKAKPGGFTFGSSGIGAGSHLSGELFKFLSGIELLHVPYKGGGQGVAAVISGETDMMFAPIAAAIPHVRSGRLRGMAVTTAVRTKAAPEIPTMIEAGVANYESFPWYGLLVPMRTPKLVIDILEKASAEALAMPDTQERLTALGVDIPKPGRAEFSRLIKAERDRWSTVIRKAGLRTN